MLPIAVFSDIAIASTSNRQSSVNLSNLFHHIGLLYHSIISRTDKLCSLFNLPRGTTYNDSGSLTHSGSALIYLNLMTLLDIEP